MTDDGRLPTELWVMAQVRACAQAGTPAYVVRKGAPAGGVVVKVVTRQAGCRLFTQTRDMAGRLAWLDVFGENADESRADDYITRSLSRDPDLWVVEIEDDGGKNPFDGRILAP